MNENKTAQVRYLEFLFSEIGEVIEEIQNNGSSEELDSGCGRLERIVKALRKEVLENGAA